MIRVERYADSDRAEWDRFVARSKNGIFQFQRNYMDYHRDRFADHSLMIYDDARLIALLPANLSGATLESHGGLSYGGFVTDSRMTAPLMLRVFGAALAVCRAQGIETLRYKAMPPIYQRIPAQEDLYALFRCGAQVIDRRAISVIDSRARIPFQERRRRGIARARKAGLHVCRSDELLPIYWALLTETLQERHHAEPTHSLAEMARLQAAFPQAIQLYVCAQEEEVIAGVLVYETVTVARAQYIASNPTGQALGALDLIFDHLLNQVFRDKPYFDFGTSNHPVSGALNLGLIEQKEGFGARAVAQDIYQLDLTRWTPEVLV